MKSVIMYGMLLMDLILITKDLYYINGHEKYSDINGCHDKEKPLTVKKYIIPHPIYFASESKK